MPAVGVLIVDDQEDIRLLIRAIIENAEGELFVAGEAADGHAALQLIDETDPHVVILDDMMPGMTGVETATRILAARPDQRMLLCTAYLTDGLQRAAEAAGIRACIGKDQVFDLPRMMRALTSDLSGGDPTPSG